MTNFDRAMCLCGLTTRAGSDIFDQPYDEVAAWRLGQKDAPEAAWKMLSLLRAQIEAAATRGARSLQAQGIDPLQLDRSLALTIADQSLPAGAREAAGALATLIYMETREDTASSVNGVESPVLPLPASDPTPRRHIGEP